MISSASETGVCFSISITGISSRGTFVDLFASTLGQAGAAVSKAKRSSSSETEVELELAAAVRLQSVIEKPGPFREVSKGPEYILVGLMSHFVSGVS